MLILKIKYGLNHIIGPHELWAKKFVLSPNRCNRIGAI